MGNTASLRRRRYEPTRPPGTLTRAFGGLKVRYKLAILHNLFFAVLAASVYVSLIPPFAAQLQSAKERESRMLYEVFSSANASASHADLTAYAAHEGPASDVGLSRAGETFLRMHPDGTWAQSSDTLFRQVKGGLYRRVTLPTEMYDAALRRARISLFAALGTIYVLSIVVLEFLIMPVYVYQPLTLMLAADRATQREDRDNELIDSRFILNDEIGQIMRSRNETVAQLRRHEDDLAQALQKLEEQDRLVSLGLLSTSVAHELNTPLAVLQGSIEKLVETTRDAHTQERLARMLRVTQRLRKISEGLVDFARVRKKETEAVPLNAIIEESWNLVAIDEKAAAVNFANAVSPADKVLGNSDRLIQVFVNLLRNALLAVPAGGDIHAESKRVQRNGQTWICCTVHDNGPGIPDHVLPSLFEAFVTTRLDARGTGLGLTVAEGIVSQHGGTISAYNRPDGGASLEVLLPAG